MTNVISIYMYIDIAQHEHIQAKQRIESTTNTNALYGRGSN